MKKTIASLLACLLIFSQVACAGTKTPAADITVDTSSFSGNLNNTDVNVQAALNTLDQVLGGLSSVNWGDIHGLLSNQSDLQAALNSKISGVSWGQITGSLASQTDLQTALTGKVATTTTVNGHALSANVTITATDVGLGNVQNVDTTIASNISSGILSNSRLANIPNTAINWTSLSKNIQTGGINWQSVINSEIQSLGINWPSLNKNIQTGGINWQSVINSEIQSLGINWASAVKSIQTGNVNWQSVINAEIQRQGINWTSLNQSVQATGVNWTSLSKNIQTGGINWQSVINSEIQSQGLNWPSVSAQITEGAFNFSNITTGNASITKHGLLPILPNSSSVFLNGIGTFTTPPGSGTISSSTIGYYAQYTGATTIGGIQFIQAAGINWTSLNASQVQANGVNWSSLNQNIQSAGVNWNSLNKVIQTAGVNWTSLLNSEIQRGGVNWTSLIQSVQAFGINWTSLNQSIQSTGINWASVSKAIQTGNINWQSVINMELQAAGINWASVIQVIQAAAINWPSVNSAQLQGNGVNWTSVGNVATGGTFTSNGFNTVGAVAGALKMYELPSNGSTFLALQAPNSVPSSVTWTLPGADASGCFQSNGSGTISIGTCGGGSGTVNTGTQYQIGYYAANGTTISGAANILTDSSSDLTIGGTMTTGGTGQSSVGYGLIVNNSGSSTSSGGDLSFKNASGTTIFSLGATSGNMTIPVTGSIQCLHASASGVVSGTGSDCGSGGGGLSSFTSPSSTIQIGGSLTNPTVDVNWTTLNVGGNLGAGGINWSSLNLNAMIGTGAMNWASINSLAKINSSGINWTSLTSPVIQAAGINWTSLLSQQIQSGGINFTSLNSVITSTGINWSSFNSAGKINAGAFTSVTGSGNQFVLATSPTITTPSVITGIKDTNGNTLMSVTATASAVDNINVANASTTNPVVLSAVGTDSSISITLTPKGSGTVNASSGITAGGTGQSSYAYGININSAENSSASGGDFQINTANVGIGTFLVSATLGNVGIGTLNPGVALDIGANLRMREKALSGQSAGTLKCVKADGTDGYCSGSITGVVCSTCN